MSQRYIGGLIYNPPGGFSGYFDGSGDYLTAGTTSSFNFLHNSSALFTIEAWIYCASFSSSPAIFGTNSGASAEVGGVVWISTGAQLRLLIGRGAAGSPVIDATSSGTVPTNQWVHIAVTYDQSLGSSNCTFYINGVSAGTANKTGNAPSSSNSAYPGTINGFGTTGGAACYLSNVRVNNSIVYSAAFTPPVGPLQAITNTSLLTCAYPTFRDGSSNNFTITVNGNTAVSAQNPFPQTQLPNPALGNQGNGVYSMSQYQALRSQNLWPAIDPYFDYVTLLLHGNGTNGAQNNTFLDSSTNNFTITRNGNTTQGTFTPYGSNWSNLFPGATGTWLSVPNDAGFQFGTGDFTMEAWIFITGNTVTDPNGNRGAAICAGVPGTSVNNSFWFQLDGNTTTTGTGLVLNAWNGGTYGLVVNSTNPVPQNTWNHVAVTRSGNTARLFLNGVLQATNTFTNSVTAGTSALTIGYAQTGTSGNFNLPFPGYISNLRIVKGTAVYTANFTPSTAPLTAISGTSLLTCQDNRFRDNSTNNFTVSVTGSPSVQRFSPFNPTTPYAAGTIGGSGYFDGSGDWLNLSGGSSTAIGTGSGTVEFWMYATANDGYRRIVTSTNAGFTSGTFVARFNNGNFLVGVNGSEVTVSLPTTNQWYHIAWVGTSGTSQTVYINGVSAGTGGSYNATESINFVGGNYNSNSEFFAGYLAGVRVVKGTAVYTGAFTPPTTPPTAITNTSLLLNYTNGGIIDNAMMNDLETVGNAQISTSVSKFGGGSLAFDGTGDYLVSNAATTDLYAFGTGDFTLEFWLYLNSASGVIILFDPRNSSETNCPVVYMSSGVLYFYVNNVNVITGATLSTSTWYHIALARSGSSTRLFVNGTQSGSTYTDTNNYVCQSNRPIIGANGFVSGGGVGIYALNGYIDDLRITKGYARYTANFTPPAAPFPTY